jgi:RNA polymerase sigma-70 factor (ECF subfamily)
MEKLPQCIGDKQRAFLREVTPLMDFLLKFALRFTRDINRAEDLVQETYLKAFRFWNRYSTDTNVRAWLCRIMVNSYINSYRKEKNEPEQVEYDETRDSLLEMRHSSYEPLDVVNSAIEQSMNDTILRALDGLPDEFRTVIILCDLEDWDYKEIADFMMIPIGTVRSRLHRGRLILQETLGWYAEQRGMARIPLILMEDT